MMLFVWSFCAGLANQVVPKAELETLTQHYALTMAQNAPLTLRSAKASVEQLLRAPEQRDPALLEKLIADCFNSQDYQEGVQAFAAQRRPQCQRRSALRTAHGCPNEEAVGHRGVVHATLARKLRVTFWLQPALGARGDGPASLYDPPKACSTKGARD